MIRPIPLRIVLIGDSSLDTPVLADATVLLRWYAEFAEDPGAPFLLF
jgi:hypothetical protein